MTYFCLLLMFYKPTKSTVSTNVQHFSKMFFSKSLPSLFSIIPFHSLLIFRTFFQYFLTVFFGIFSIFSNFSKQFSEFFVLFFQQTHNPQLKIAHHRVIFPTHLSFLVQKYTYSYFVFARIRIRFIFANIHICHPLTHRTKMTRSH